jgi:hypothetical protein
MLLFFVIVDAVNSDIVNAVKFASVFTVAIPPCVLVLQRPDQTCPAHSFQPSHLLFHHPQTSHQQFSILLMINFFVFSVINNCW